jgi:ribosome-associated translation inhibitor RaiA
MTTHLVFNRIDKTESIESFALAHVENVVEKFKKLLGKGRSTVRLSMLNSPTQAGADSFACEILVQSRDHSPFVVKEVGSNLYSAIAAASLRLSSVLSRWHKRRLDKFKRRPAGLKRSSVAALRASPP